MNKGEGGEFVAATALTTLMPASKEEKNQDEFKIPVKFTRCGRRMATPFPMKVRNNASIKDFTRWNVVTVMQKTYQHVQTRS
mmetsp:Transcript_23813/g.31041  ORF Transcript_23813/g.31041 Transcript_23813/m.31041 type:complete len:82 (-) Transcript_23813:516-761(-)